MRWSLTTFQNHSSDQFCSIAFFLCTCKKMPIKNAYNEPRMTQNQISSTTYEHILYFFNFEIYSNLLHVIVWHSILSANQQFKIEEGLLLEGGFKKKYLMQGLPQNGEVVFRGELEPRTKLWYNIITVALREICKIFISQNCNLQSRQVD